MRDGQEAELDQETLLYCAFNEPRYFH